jgi:transglutaminase-like putative cysteine protease
MTLSRWALVSVLASLAVTVVPLRATDFPPISPEDLKMTSLPEQPGAPAFILMREEVDDDMHNLQSVHARIKILTEAGREYANVEIPYSRRSFTVGGISGRTTHADGSVVPFEGKPFDKTVIKGGNIKVNVKTFTLPDVQVGSIIEYKYELRYDDNILFAPEWEVQQELFQRRTYFKYIPFQNHGSMEVQLAHGQIANGVAWTPFLGVNKAPQIHRIEAAEASYMTAQGQATHWIDLDLDNVPAFVEEAYMPPASMVRWRVYFYYQENLKSEDYWKSQGKFWSKDAESFIGRDKGVGATVAKIVQPSDSPEQKVRKIYAYVSEMENQDYVPERSKNEAKVLQIKINKGAEDVLANRSGTHDELNRLFVSMVRAAGIPRL